MTPDNPQLQQALKERDAMTRDRDGWIRHAQTSDREVTQLRQKLHDCEETLGTYAYAAESAERLAGEYREALEDIAEGGPNGAGRTVTAPGRARAALATTEGEAENA